MLDFGDSTPARRPLNDVLHNCSYATAGLAAAGLAIHAGALDIASRIANYSCLRRRFLWIQRPSSGRNRAGFVLGERDD